MRMQLTHEGRVAVVTGGGRGLGRVMALALAGAGARVLITGRDRGALSETCEAGDGKGQMSALEVEAADPDAPARIVEAAVSRYGGLDILVNNAGTTVDVLRRAQGRPAPTLMDLSEAEFQEVLHVNTIAPFFLSRAAIAPMQKRGGGRIVNITTSLDTMWRKGLIPYGCSKAANEANCVALAHELADTGITVNVLTPGGPADTQMMPPDILREKLIPPAVMAEPLLWITGPDAGHVTAMRFIAARWDVSLSGEEAAKHAGAPAAWQQLGAQAIYRP